MSDLGKMKRRNYWIDPKVQWAIIQKTLLMNVALVAILYFADKFFYMRMESMGKDLGFSPEHAYFLFLQEQQKAKFWAFLLTSGVISILGMLIGVRFSHRLAGPIFRLKKEIKRLNAGEKIEEINLRDADFFRELAEEINALTKKLGLRK